MGNAGEKWLVKKTGRKKACVSWRKMGNFPGGKRWELGTKSWESAAGAYLSMKPKIFQSCEKRLWKWSLKPGLVTELRKRWSSGAHHPLRKGREDPEKDWGSVGSAAAPSLLWVPRRARQSPKSLPGHQMCWGRAEGGLGRLLGAHVQHGSYRDGLLLCRNSAGATLLWDRVLHGSPWPDPNPQGGTTEAEILPPLPCCRRGLLRLRGGFAQSLLQRAGGMERAKDVSLRSHLNRGWFVISSCIFPPSDLTSNSY